MWLCTAAKLGSAQQGLAASFGNTVCLMAFSHSPVLGYWSSSAAAEETQSYGHGRARVTDEAEILIFFFVVVQKGDVIALGLQFQKV